MQIDPEDGRFPMLLVGLTYICGLAATASVFVATGSLLWSAVAMFGSGIFVPLALVTTPGIRRAFVQPGVSPGRPANISRGTEGLAG